MRTTVRLDDHLLKQAKKEAARRNVTLTSLIDEGLRMVLAQSERHGPRKKVRLPVCRAGGGTLPGVDLDNAAGLLNVMEGRS